MDNILDSSFTKTKDDLLNMNRHPRNIKGIIDEIKSFSEQNANGITSTQLRNIYNKALEFKNKSPESLQLLRPKLAYAIARNNSKKAKDIISLFDLLIEKVKTIEDVSGFLTFLEAFVSYHKYYETLKSK